MEEHLKKIIDEIECEKKDLDKIKSMIEHLYKMGFEDGYESGLYDNPRGIFDDSDGGMF